MATNNQGMDYTIVAGADLSASQYCAVTMAGIIAATGQTFGGIFFSFTAVLFSQSNDLGIPPH